MFKIISTSSDPTPTYVADTKEDLAIIKKQQWDSNVLGIAALVLDDGDGKPMLYVMNAEGEWM